ncbi:signal peptidase [Parapedobacter tibetensis]|uniref:signal peptidase n=1 Tax=Parapedobacter tibetensis TaxID=2972951 RepID=UPI00214DEFFF|nr:signal peptidase [Parapedobacter tibetensis]
MNKYLLRGLVYTMIGLALCAFGYYLMEQENLLYKWAMIVGVIVFGIGFLMVIYGFIRKIERRSIVHERKERQMKK